MDLAKRTEHSLWRGCAALAVVCAAVLCANPAAAQVDIDMPPPPKAKAKKPAQPAGQGNAAATPAPASAKLSAMQREGRQALSRFAGARYSGYERYPLDRRRYRYRPYYVTHFHPYFYHTFHFGFCW